MHEAETPEPGMPLALALFPFVVLAGCMAASLAFMGSDNGTIVMSMLAATACAGAIAKRQGSSWDAIQEAAGKQVGELFPALVILLLIGALVGSWMASGTIPYFVAVGLRLVSPDHFVLTAFLATATMSLVTGTSWGSAGTLGVALMGMAGVLDADLAMTAGAVISGAYFGDKMSPISDTTIVSALAAKAELYAHIRHMTYTAFPSFVAACIVFGLMAATGTAAPVGLPPAAARLVAELEGSFALGWPVLIPPVIVICAIYLRVPAALAMAGSALVAVLVAIVWQGTGTLDAIASAMTGFEVSMVGGQGADTASEAFTTLVARGGMFSMTAPFVIIFAASLLTGALSVSGALDTIVSRLLMLARGTFSLVASTLTAGIVAISLSSHGSISALLVGGLFQDAYHDRGLAPVNLSRSIEDSVTLTDPILPWTVSGVFMSTTLGVGTLDYLPWTIFCLGGVVFSLLIAACGPKFGYGIRRLDDA